MNLGLIFYVLKCLIVFCLFLCFKNGIFVPKSKMMKKILQYKFIFVLLFLCSQSLLRAQGIQNEFGKNRVQYHDDFDEWQQYETASFVTYWYGKARPVGQIASQIAEAEVAELQVLLEYRTNQKIELVVYADVTDLRQSNMGGEETFMSVKDETKTVGNKIFVYFDGNHQHLRRNIREGIATVYLNAMLIGGNLQEMVQNAVMISLPDWYTKGVSAYAAEEWNPELDAQLRDVIMSNKYENFVKFAAKEPKLAGHAFWYFIGQNFGKATVSNLLYLTRINRNIESGFIYVLGGNIDKISDSWMQYFKLRYDEDQKNTSDFGKEIKISNRRNAPITQLKISPNGRELVYVVNEIGKYKVYHYNISKNERKLIYKGGFRNNFQATDYNYPLVAWKPNGKEIGIIVEHRDVPKFVTYELENNKKSTELLAPEYQRVYSMDFLTNTELVFSASTNGFSDIFVYKTIGRTSENITNDFYDDHSPCLVQLNGRKGIIFSSNRSDTLLSFHKLDTLMPTQNTDLFYFGLDAPRSKSLIQLTATPELSEQNPYGIDSTWFGYIDDASGRFDRKSSQLDTIVAYFQKIVYLKNGGRITTHQDSMLAQLDPTFVDSTRLVPVYRVIAKNHASGNHSANIMMQSKAVRSDKIAILSFSQNRYHINIETINGEDVVTAKNTIYKQLKQRKSSKNTNEQVVSEPIQTIDNTLKDFQTKVKIEDEDSIDVRYIDYFQSEFPNYEPAKKANIVTAETVLPNLPAATFEDNAEKVVAQSTRFKQSRILAYRLKFRFDGFSSRFDNSLLFGGLNSYAGDKQGGFSLPNPGLLLKTNVKELMEDYEIEGGMRIPTSLNGTEYFVVIDNRKHQWDKRFAYYRQSVGTPEAASFGIPPRRRNISNIGYAEFRYPLDIFSSFRFAGTFRLDQRIQQSTDSIKLKVPTQRTQRVGLRAEYVFDNTLDVAMNIKNGTRAKLGVEVLKRIQVQLVDKAQFKFNKGFMTTISLDARHYQRLDKRSIVAFRLAGATSFGSENILFYLGGVDQGFNNGFDNSVDVPQGQNFAYQTFAAQMRGFRTNIRNGQSYLLMNTELRVPVLRYIKEDWRSNFWKNMQVVGFFDVGTAWHGLNPFGKDNPLNTVSIINPDSPISIKVNYFRDPIIAGYGAGLHTTLFGYFIKIDKAWGIETKTVQSPVWHFSIGMDF